MDAKRAWEATLGELELQMTKATFDTWLKNTCLVSFEDGCFVVGVPNAYAKDWLRHRLYATIKDTLTRIFGATVDLKFTLLQHQKRSHEIELLSDPRIGKSEPTSKSASRRIPYQNPKLNPKYTFDSFVVGNSNRLAHAAAKAVAENPARAYNPLYIYGGVGLGKTHLLQAIGGHFVGAGMHVVYIPAETFTNDMINAIQRKTTDAFRAKYRTIDALLIDDVQFVAGKEGTQEELFHTFNSLYESGHQIVLSSDRPPKAINSLEARLRSRFEWGLIADIQPPDLETRIAILRVKAEELGLHVDGIILETIAQKVTSNIRELEGALNRLCAYSRALRVPLGPTLVEQALGDILQRPHDLELPDILRVVADHYSISEETIKSKRRDKATSQVRQIIMYLAREETQFSLAQIGRELGGRDHTTILHGHGKIESLVETDDQLRRDVFTLKEMLYKDES